MLSLFFILLIVPASFALENASDIQLADNFDNLDDEIPIQQVVEDSTETNDESNDEVISLNNNDSNPVSVDYYFDSSIDEDGDGSLENPYKTLTSGRLKSSSTIHLANGEYNLTAGKSLNGVTIIGEDVEKTIIRYTGSSNSGKFSLSVDNYLILCNVTFIGFNFDIEGATLQANNTIFKNAAAFPTYSSGTNLVNSATSSFGGAIYAYSYQTNYNNYLPMVFLDNCTFINNTAEYGGAIYMNQGTLDINNSCFINNYAYNYGGALSIIFDVSAKIKNSKFVNDKSLNDAGGAIYLYKSILSGTNLSAVNCSATFGSFIASINATTALAYLNAENNTAKYEGGVIYQIYNAISVTDSIFKNNSARNGGAIYVDELQILKLNYNVFENNRASNTAGAVYSMIVPKSNENYNNNYTENKASNHNDFYQAERIILTIGNGNYTLYFNNYTFDGNLPSSYDLRDYDLVTSVKDQQSGGNCWAFGSIAALESAILKASGEHLDLSEENMKNLMQLYSDYGWSGIETNDGGFDDMAIGYLTSWLGPVLESIEEYDDYSMLSPVLNSIAHVQNIVYLGRDTYTDNDKIKEAIMKYGAVSTGIYYDSTYFSSFKNSYYYYGSSSANHAVAIVGWDDNYSSTNFNYKPAGNGAWIVKNSWNSYWGDGGYFYVSYYDTRLAQVGVPDYSYAFIFNDTVRYDKNYQYDIAGKTDYLITGEKTVWVENIFDATDNELLAAVSTYFYRVTDWNLFIYLNDELAISKNGTSAAGYYTIDLGEYVPLSAGDKFKIVFKLSCDDGVDFAISEKATSNKLSYSPGVSFFSFDGENWTDLFDYKFETSDGEHYYNSQVACIKAFTILYELKPTLDFDIDTIYNTVNIMARVHDQYGNLVRSGEIIFNIEGIDKVVGIENAIANLSYTFQNKGSYNITANFRNFEENIGVNITKININLVLDISKNQNNVVLRFESSRDVNSTVAIKVNNEIYYKNLSGGKAVLNLNDLDFGYYNLNISVIDEDYASEINSGFNITIIKTLLIANDFITYYNGENPFSVLLRDVNGNPVKNHMISFIVNGKSYVSTTDDDGQASVVVKLSDLGTYSANVLFYGDDSYFPSSSTVKFIVKSTILSVPNNYLSGSSLVVKLIENDGNALYKNQVNIKFNGNSYWLISDNNGVVSQSLNLKAGNYIVTVNNIETGEITSKTIKVVSRIMENKNINCYFGSNGVYKVRVYADSGNAVSAGEIVKFKVGAKTYNVKTDKNGYASFKLNKLNLKSYIITASYKGFKISNKIVVKPVLTAKNISKKKSKKVKFTAKLVNNKGKAVKGKKITFKIKGKKYFAKTNKKGIATVYLKNLKPGKYIITSKYSKSLIKNVIKIRK